MPQNQLAHVASCTPGVDRIVSTWLEGIGKIIDVDRIVTTRVDELAAATASNPSSTACSDANRNTAIATLSVVKAVRRRLRRTLFRTRPMYFMTFSPLRGPRRASARRRSARAVRPASLFQDA